jgi:hypothetical protein
MGIDAMFRFWKEAAGLQEAYERMTFRFQHHLQQSVDYCSAAAFCLRCMPRVLSVETKSLGGRQGIRRHQVMEASSELSVHGDSDKAMDEVR